MNATLYVCRHGGVVRCLKSLLRQKLVHHDNSKYDGYRLTSLGYDFLALKALVSRCSIAFFHQESARLGEIQSKFLCPLNTGCTGSRTTRGSALNASVSAHLEHCDFPMGFTHTTSGAVNNRVCGRGSITAVGRQIGVGKESDVYEVTIYLALDFIQNWDAPRHILRLSNMCLSKKIYLRLVIWCSDTLVFDWRATLGDFEQQGWASTEDSVGLARCWIRTVRSWP